MASWTTGLALWLQAGESAVNGQSYLLLVLAISILSLIVAAALSKFVISQDTGTPQMQRISNAIKQGAEAFLRRQNKTILTLSLVLAIIIFLGYYFGKGSGQLAVRMTVSFIAGMVAWGTLIGLMRFGEPVFGMMHQPFIREHFTGDGGGAHYRGPAGDRDLHVRSCAALNDAVLFTTSPLLMNAADRAIFQRVENVVKLSRYGGDCYAYCMLAAGHIDLVIETDIKPHDIVPLIPIITGAGGVITTWENGPAQTGGRIVAAGDKRVHEAALAMLKA
jgi:hypothetical protein